MTVGGEAAGVRVVTLPAVERDVDRLVLVRVGRRKGMVEVALA